MSKLVLAALWLFLAAFPTSLFAHSPDAVAARVPVAVAAHQRVAQDATVSLIGARDRYIGSAAGEQMR